MTQAFSKTFTPAGSGAALAAGNIGGMVWDTNTMLYTYARNNIRYIDVVTADQGWNNPASTFTVTQAFNETLTGGYNNNNSPFSYGVYMAPISASSFLVGYVTFVSQTYYLNVNVFTISGTTVTKASSTTLSIGLGFNNGNIFNYISQYSNPSVMVQQTDGKVLVVFMNGNYAYYSQISWNGTSLTNTSSTGVVGTLNISNWEYLELWVGPKPYTGSSSYNQMIGFRSNTTDTWTTSEVSTVVFGPTSNPIVDIARATKFTSDIVEITAAKRLYMPDWGTVQYYQNSWSTGGLANVSIQGATGTPAISYNLLYPLDINYTLVLDRDYFASTSKTALTMKVLRYDDQNFIEQSSASANTTKGFTVAIPGTYITPQQSQKRPQLTSTNDLYWMGFGADGTYGFKCIRNPGS